MIYYTGKGGFLNKTDIFLLFLGISSTLAICLVEYKKASNKFQLKVIQNNDYSANINMRINANIDRYVCIKKIINKNIECLKNKGYLINENLNEGYLIHTNFNKYLLTPYFWNNITYLETVDYSYSLIPRTFKLSKEKLIKDCKECNVHTEIIYEYDDIFLNEKQNKKEFYWHECYKDKLK
jgi:hypothetical protein